jgi:hypothetical protein
MSCPRWLKCTYIYFLRTNIESAWRRTEKVRFNSAFHKIRPSFYATEFAGRVSFVPNLKIGQLTLRLPRAGSTRILNIRCAWRDDRLAYNNKSIRVVR